MPSRMSHADIISGEQDHGGLEQRHSLSGSSLDPIEVGSGRTYLGAWGLLVQGLWMEARKILGAGD